MLLTTSQAAGELGVAVTTFRRLIHAGLLPRPEYRGARAMTPLETVQALQARPRPDPRTPEHSAAAAEDGTDTGSAH